MALSLRASYLLRAGILGVLGVGFCGSVLGQAEEVPKGSVGGLVGPALQNDQEKNGPVKPGVESVETVRAALKNMSREQDGVEWAKTQRRLCRALVKQAEQSTDHAQACAMLDEAVAACRAGLLEFTHEKSAKDWMDMESRIGAALVMQSGFGEDKAQKFASLEQAVAVYRAAVQEATREPFPRGWADLQSGLGTALSEQAFLMEEARSIAPLREAADAYHRALEVYSRREDAWRWMNAQIGLGVALRQTWVRELNEQRVHGGKKPEVALLEECVEALHASLTVATPSMYGDDWAKAQDHLGLALYYLARFGDLKQAVDRLRQAVATDRLALTYNTRERFPYQWATCRENLARALLILGQELRKQAGNSGAAEAGSLLSEAVDDAQEAVQIYTREPTPKEWPVSQEYLGDALMDRTKLLINQAELGSATAPLAKLLDQTVAAYKNALLVYTATGFPKEHETVQRKLADAEELLRALGR